MEIDVNHLSLVASVQLREGAIDLAKETLARLRRLKKPAIQPRVLERLTGLFASSGDVARTTKCVERLRAHGHTHSFKADELLQQARRVHEALQKRAANANPDGLSSESARELELAELDSVIALPFAPE